jgi:sialate O-acetylesterase
MKTNYSPALTRLLTILPLSVASIFAAEFRLAAPVCDHMVLQREKPVPIWGFGDSGETVTVSFGGQTKSASVDSTGKWLVKLDPLAASAESRKMVIAAKSAARSIEVNDVLVGEVWLGSGQSNMAMTVSSSANFEQEKNSADLPLIRHFRDSSGPGTSPQTETKGKWEVSSSQSVGGFSATLYFFGREIQRELGVPVGLINTSVGGTPIESWIAAKTQAEDPKLKDAHSADIANYTAFNPEKAMADYEKALEQWKKADAEAKTSGAKPPRKPTDPVQNRKSKGGPGELFNGKVAPLVPYAVRGMLWYQGEANASVQKAPLYVHQLSALVTDWRKLWKEELPFAWVQLPNYKSTEGWPLMRESMMKTLALPKTGMAITLDIGDAEDIHPKNKQDVGKRLSLWALGTVYGKKVAATSGPLPSGHKIQGNEISVSFNHADGGLKAAAGELKGFQIAGADETWKPARARVSGNSVVVANPEITAPVAVRYAWSDLPDGNLRNGAGLPATSFRTDEWPVPALTK